MSPVDFESSIATLPWQWYRYKFQLCLSSNTCALYRKAAFCPTKPAPKSESGFHEAWRVWLPASKKQQSYVFRAFSVAAEPCVNRFGSEKIHEISWNRVRICQKSVVGHCKFLAWLQWHAMAFILAVFKSVSSWTSLEPCAMDVCRRELVCQQAVGWADGVTFEMEAIQISNLNSRRCNFSQSDRSNYDGIVWDWVLCPSGCFASGPAGFWDAKAKASRGSFGLLTPRLDLCHFEALLGGAWPEAAWAEDLGGGSRSHLCPEDGEIGLWGLATLGVRKTVSFVRVVYRCLLNIVPTGVGSFLKFGSWSGFTVHLAVFLWNVACTTKV